MPAPLVPLAIMGLATIIGKGVSAAIQNKGAKEANLRELRFAEKWNKKNLAEEQRRTNVAAAQDAKRFVKEMISRDPNVQSQLQNIWLKRGR